MNKATTMATVLLKKMREHTLNMVSLGALLLLVFVVYGRDISMLVNEALQNESLNHVLLVPFLAGLLFYMKRDVVEAALAIDRDRPARYEYEDRVVGMVLCLIAFLTYWYGSYTFYPLELHLLSLPIFIAGTIVIMLSMKALRVLVVPVLFLFFLVPMPAEIVYQAGTILSNFNTMISHAILTTFGIPVALSSSYGPPTLMLTATSSGGSASFTVDVPCSGVYSILAFAMLGTFLFFVTRGSLVRKTAMISIGFLIFEILNVLRIVSIVSIAYGYSVEAAMTIFHSAAGTILIFTGMMLTLFMAEKAFKVQVLPRTREALPCPECQKSTERYESFCAQCGRLLEPIRQRKPRRFWIRLSLLFLCSLILSISVNAPTLVLAQKSIATSNPDTQTGAAILPQIPNCTLAYLGRDLAYEKAADLLVSFRYAYHSTVNSSAPRIYTYVSVGDSLSNLHNWEVCLISWQTAQGLEPLVKTLESRDMQLLGDPPIVARYLVFHESQRNYTQSTLYWFQRAPFNTGTTVEQKYVRISLIIITQNTAEYQQFESPLLKLAQDIAENWGSLTNKSLISLGIPAQQLLLGSSIVFLFAAKSVQFSNERRKRNANLRLFNTLASVKERTALEAIINLSGARKNIEATDVEKAIAKKTLKRVRLGSLLKVMRKLEEYDLIRREVISVNNSPMVVWRTRVSSLYKS